MKSCFLMIVGEKMKMNEELDEILEKFNKNEEKVEDVYKLKKLADQGNTKAALNYEICLFVGHLVDEDKEEASKYFEKIYISRRIEELNELADFYDEVGKPAYENISDMVVKKAMAKFKELSFEDQLDFFMKYANKNMVDEVPKLFADLKDLS